MPCCCSVAKSCPTLTSWTAACQASLSFTCFAELAQTHIHRVGNAIQPSHSLSSPSLPAFNLAQHQGLLQGISCSHQVDKVSVLTMNIQDLFPLGLTHWISLQSKGLSRVFSNTQFKSINSSALSFLHSPTLTSIRDH